MVLYRLVFLSKLSCLSTEQERGQSHDLMRTGFPRSRSEDGQVSTQQLFHQLQLP